MERTVRILGIDTAEPERALVHLSYRRLKLKPGAEGTPQERLIFMMGVDASEPRLARLPQLWGFKMKYHPTTAWDIDPNELLANERTTQKNTAPKTENQYTFGEEDTGSGSQESNPTKNTGTGGTAEKEKSTVEASGATVSQHTPSIAGAAAKDTASSAKTKASGAGVTKSGGVAGSGSKSAKGKAASVAASGAAAAAKDSTQTKGSGGRAARLQPHTGSGSRRT